MEHTYPNEFFSEVRLIYLVFICLLFAYFLD